MNRCLKLPVHVFNAYILVFALFELLMFFVDLFLHFFAVVLALASSQSLNFNFMAEFGIVLS